MLRVFLTPKPEMQSLQPPNVAKLAYALLTIQTVCAITGLERRFIYRAIAAGSFPPPVRIGNSRHTRWRAVDVSAWANSHKTSVPKGKA